MRNFFAAVAMTQRAADGAGRRETPARELHIELVPKFMTTRGPPVETRLLEANR